MQAKLFASAVGCGGSSGTVPVSPGVGFGKIAYCGQEVEKYSKIVRKSTVAWVRRANKANELELLILVRWQSRYGLVACW